ncbi:MULTISPECIES: peptide antibiotic transporter SbmA [Rhizobium]|uniref:Transporter involved in cell envelope modification n=1 Tax=Rhizobium leguminosarum TaxID=384 RepID=A0A2K9Z6R2_RHILE|nr:peptide antibiotic transporter SbmA [Rhizobium leguminosarum]AUW43791.1 transporter involved in cell envelope modification [Rhizobium leguminosarum]MBY2921438.1 peptide antibiotic transporter SbmA [Rhizobium leguminosarum]MBY2938672.1 peptide antibiotic transporter SbmA [Rhizobium leguminosarum]MBY3021316.1 peptide antibiotic transporter SbmA [Rhizobium leguminosarum]MBY3029258.1 peptide antibiotic transporter SbmA [Rhizobium leguminosarum]
MFHSFFPRPKLFFTSAVAWTLACVFFWYFAGIGLLTNLGFPPLSEDAQPVGAAFFVAPTNLLFYLFFILCSALFCGVWHVLAHAHPWKIWSVWGSALIIFITYFGVQMDVAINVWRGPFFDLLQNALAGKPGITNENFYYLILKFLEIGTVGVIVSVASAFLINHYVLRWRVAMNDFYMSKWQKLRHIEGASQRVQEDTMRFANIIEGLGVSLIGSVMTLIVFLPILSALSAHVTDLPILGAVPNSLVWLALGWSVLGTVLLAVVGVKLPGLNFRNQRVEAAYRKELVYGEDHEDRAQPVTVAELFSNVRRNYFRMYFHYLYFNVARYSYGQLDAIFLYFVLVPTFVAHKITLGIWQQIATAFGQVSNSFQYLVSSWTTIIELLSIHKRLQAFEAAIDDEPLPEIDQRYLEREAGIVHADG